jgi:hypothetical protein
MLNLIFSWFYREPKTEEIKISSIW